MPKDEANTEDLIKGMLAGDETAYLEFSDRYGPWIARYLETRGLNRADAEALAVTCISEIGMAIRDEKYQRMDASFDAFVFGVVRHLLADWYRESRHEIPLNAVALAVADEFVPDMDVVLAIDDALPTLSQADQQIIGLRYFQEFEPSYQEIAATLGIKEDTARVRHHRALGRLRSILKQDSRVRRKLSRVCMEQPV